MIRLVLSLAGIGLGFFVGLLFGAFIGGNFGFPELFGMRGYESGGIVFAALGALLAGVLPWVLGRKAKAQ